MLLLSVEERRAPLTISLVMCSMLLIRDTEFGLLLPVRGPPSQLQVCEANDISLRLVMDHRVCISENGMLSDLTVERKGFVPAPSRPRSTSIADFVANPKLDGVNYSPCLSSLT